MSRRTSRRQAFYSHQRAARALQRLLAVDWHHSTERAMVDALIHGTGFVQLERVEPRYDIDPLTGKPWALPWRVRHVPPDEFRREFGGKWPDDFCPPAKP